MKRVIIDDNWIPEGYVQNSVDITASDDMSKDVLEVTYKVRFIKQSSITQAKKAQQCKPDNHD